MAKRDTAVVLDTWPVMRLDDGIEPAATEAPAVGARSVLCASACWRTSRLVFHWFGRPKKSRGLVNP